MMKVEDHLFHHLLVPLGEMPASSCEGNYLVHREVSEIPQKTENIKYYLDKVLGVSTSQCGMINIKG